MTVNFNNFKDEEQILIQKVYDVAFNILAVPQNMSVNLVVVDEEQIRQFNKQFRNIDKVTDVLSFPMLDKLSDAQDEIDADFGDVNIGDVYICRERATKQAQEYGHSYVRELCFLAVHGLLHVLGYDHILPEEEAEMFELQDQILNLANVLR